MKGRTIKNLFASGLFFAAITIAYAQDPLPSWNDTAPKKAIVAFVERVTKEGSPDFVKPEERLATFDNDGTLWAEQPIYFQFAFAIDRVRRSPRSIQNGKSSNPSQLCFRATRRRCSLWVKRASCKSWR
jgi:hypothetical protein